MLELWDELEARMIPRHGKGETYNDLHDNIGDAVLGVASSECRAKEDDNGDSVQQHPRYVQREAHERKPRLLKASLWWR